MPSSSRLLLAVRHRDLPLRARVDLLRAHTARRVRRARAYAVRLGPATVFLSEDDYEIDWASLAFVAVDDAYAGDYRDAFVVDLGAHKGYYGAWALRHGARGVVSYEPESTNASYLEAAAARLPGGRTWRTARVAVGAEPGEAALHVMGASWGHAIHPPDAWAEHEVGVERVRVDALADVLSRAAESARGARTIVKVNIEGEECPTILGTPAAVWADVAEVYIETHPWATCGATELAAHLADAGLRSVPSNHSAVLKLSRAETPRRE
jgi:FkbM family methyltransferase